MRSLYTLAALAIFATMAASQLVIPYTPNLRLHPFTALPAQNYSIVQGATVAIDQGFAVGDKLMMDYEGEFQISATFDSRTGVLYIQGLATVSEYINAIETVVFTTTATDGKPRLLTWSLGANTFYLPETGHYYTYYANIGVSWNQSAQNCPTYSYFGNTGYLATITSSQEHAGIASKLAASAWLGASSDSSSGTWTWQTGPEAGTDFWSGMSMYAGGMAIDSEYTAWGRFQPESYTAVAMVPSLYEATATWKSMSNAAGVTGYLCEFGGLPLVNATAGSYGGSVLLEFGCGLYTNAADCANQATLGCAWNGMCVQSSCVQYTTELLCTANSRCQWSVDSGVGLCTATACGAFSNDEPTCTKATGCVFQPSVNGVDTCADAVCSNYGRSSDCAAATGCTWNRGRCATTGGLNCTGMDIIYLIDGSAIMAQPFGLHSSGYVGIINVLAQADEVLTQRLAGAMPLSTDFGQRVGYVLYGSSKFNGVTPTGTGTGGRLTGSAAQKAADLGYLEALFPSSDTRTLTQALTQTAAMIQNSGSVAAGRKVVIVVIAAGAIADAAAVTAQVAALPYTFIGVALSQYPQSTLDSQAAVASLGMALPARSSVFELSIDDFTNSIIWGICASPLATSGVPTCDVYMSASACWQNPTCAWSNASKVCKTSACMAQSQSACLLDSTCSWDSNNNFCKSACTGSTASAACGACVTNPSEDSCIADTNGCVYNASNTIKCQLDVCATITNSAPCLATPGCTFTSNGICMRDPCSSRTRAGQAFCQQLPQCSWGPLSQGTTYGCSLMQPCGSYQGERSCVADARCKWEVSLSPPTCVPAPCLKYNVNPLTAPALCSADSACMWRLANQTGFGQAMCMVRTCDMYATACACSADDGCVWRNNTCKDSRYVQCPAIDLFFLLEASSVMSQDFGRHPNGFIGVVESIRGWSMDAPWAPDETSTGFRMGMALYAGNTAQSSPGDGIGNGPNYFVQKPSDFYGATKQLDDFEDKFTSYAAGAQGVKLRPGLAAAKTMFTNSVAGRTKMLVVLGASPFTDGSSSDEAIAPVIKELEAMGVQIFTNIIRRFSSITPTEVLASNYMLPVASEPSSSHFLFATIDEIRSTLLDQFCDPSTVTGKILGVSRDNTLPCSWLAENECSMQTNCVWNATGVKTCPMSNQCPNLGCDPLPSNLAMFTCAQCTKVSGAISCQSTPAKAAQGTCQPNSCALMYCGMTDCNADPKCSWNSDTVRCEANLCPPITSPDSCNAQLGCYWNALVTPQVCARSESWRQRSMTTCKAVTVTENKNQIVVYQWKTDVLPAVCIQNRCQNFDQTLCNSHISSEGCKYDASSLNGRTCIKRDCAYTNSLDCHSDSGCYWNPFDTLLGTCNAVPQDGSCVLSGFSNYTQCSSSCGNAIQYKSRRILRFPSNTAASSSCANIALNLGRTTGETTIVISKPCAVDASCTTHCSAYTAANDIVGCSRDVSCFWNMTCQPKSFHSCAEYDQSLCLGMDVCAWNSVTQFCEPIVTTCTLYNTSSSCASATAKEGCHWRTGTTANAMGQLYNAPTQLFNPGPVQEPIFVFPTLSLSSSDIIWGATVTIEQNFQRGKDVLQLLYPSVMQTVWDPTSGTLSLTGRGTINDYANAIRYVTFSSFSVDTTPRLVTWSLLNNTVYSAVSQHVYRYFPASGVSYSNAQALCSQSSFFGMQGYLAVIQTQRENDMIFQKLWAAGWLGAGDLSSGVWRWNSGPYQGAPLAFWQGPSSSAGGRSIGGLFANWNTISDEPNQTSVGTNGLYLDTIGTWHAYPTNWVGGAGYVCEYGGMVNDVTPSFSVYGAAVLGAAGCLPDECAHTNQTSCTLDPDCYWNNNRCQLACGGYATPLQCGTNTNCAWDDTVLPPMCAFNPCTGPKANCTNPKCIWDNGQAACIFRTGCAARLDATSCGNSAACQWSSGSCEQKPCESLGNADDCGANPLCLFVTGTGCTTAYCRSGNQGDCEADSRCEWNAVTSTAFITFNVGGSPVQPFTTVATPGSVGNLVVDGITVMITSGFQEGLDFLTVQAAVLSASSWTMNWDSQTGTLLLYAPPSTMALDAVSFLQNNVLFYSTASANQARTIAYTLGLNAFMATAGNKFVKYVPATVGNAPTTYAAAQALCSSTQFFGASGQLASITQELDALNLARLTPTAWIGAQAVNNRWTWTATGAAFWDIAAGNPGPVNGSFSYWAKNQPTFATTSATQYAVVNSNGMWSILVPGRNQGLGVVCQFAVPSGIVGSSRTASPSGCFMKACVGLGQGTCLTTPGCSWNVNVNNPNTCSVDTFCSVAPTPSSCGTLAGCYWSYSLSYCATGSATTCDKYVTAGTCAGVTNCDWDSTKLARGASTLGACVSTACAPLSADACMGNPLCVTQGTACVNRKCPYVSPNHCFQDASCTWDYASSMCFPDKCTYNGDQNSCTAQTTCYWQYNQCFRVKCTGTTAATCQTAPDCIFKGTSCAKTTCDQLSGTACSANPDCNWVVEPTTQQLQCITARCKAYSNANDCGSSNTTGSTCSWSNGVCMQGAAPGSCEKQVTPNLWWLYLLCFIILVLLGLIAWRLYLAYSKGLSFFEPARTNVKYSPHQQYAADLFEEAQTTAIESNAPGYQRPNINDL